MLKSVLARPLGICKTYGMYAFVHTVQFTTSPGKMEARPHARRDQLNDIRVVSSCPNVAQVLSVSYRADFGRRSKVGQVTANSPGTVTSPLISGGIKCNCMGRIQSMAAQLSGTSPAKEPKQSGSNFSSQSVGIL